MTKRRRPEVPATVGGPACLDCPCCAKWVAALQAFAEHARRHTAGELRIRPCTEDCLICAEIDWQGATP